MRFDKIKHIVCDNCDNKVHGCNNSKKNCHNCHAVTETAKIRNFQV